MRQTHCVATRKQETVAAIFHNLWNPPTLLPKTGSPEAPASKRAHPSPSESDVRPAISEAAYISGTSYLILHLVGEVQTEVMPAAQQFHDAPPCDHDR